MANAEKEADNCSRIKEWQMDQLFRIPLQTRKGFGIAHKCSRELLLTRRLHDSSLQQFQSSRRKDCNLCLNCSWHWDSHTSFLNHFFEIACKLLFRYQEPSDIRNLIKPDEFPSILSKIIFKYKLKDLKKNLF